MCAGALIFYDVILGAKMALCYLNLIAQFLANACLALSHCSNAIW